MLGYAKLEESARVCLCARVCMRACVCMYLHVWCVYVYVEDKGHLWVSLRSCPLCLDSVTHWDLGPTDWLIRLPVSSGFYLPRMGIKTTGH